jgi:hypothetical protein
METKVLTQDEVTQLKDIQQKRTSLNEQFGILEIQYEIQKQTLVSRLNQLLQVEEKLGKQLQEKYGDGTIDIEKGEFTSN